MVLKRFIIALAFGLLGTSSFAQSPEVLAAVRAELSALQLELQDLRSELIAPASSGAEAPLGSETTPPEVFLERIDALEAELRALTGRVERQGFETNQRLTAAEARLVALADVLQGKDGQGPLEIVEPSTDPFPERDSLETQLTAQEKTDHDRIEAAFAATEFEEAIRRSDQFILTYPGGPLTPGVMLRKAQAYQLLERWEDAAKGYLELFNQSGENDIGSRALMGLGESFEKLGRTADACRSYLQVGQLYPSSAAVVPANEAQKALNCLN